ncbi:1-aminocyclopropane-1-carboxylate deaminase/D-cysteine desulfhydrase [Microvirga pakistanensis]|uniref:1-aminocyclopropane-1-carboxylate deaminase/D-cysteine desulfhydrase n=1 Tax=Microvirga pakistanensis TaxID=1682650 RepID=UPI00106C2513|nr:pyridoxal-phosphate dependent enzyme [Microvirga pakistanensis]
MLDAFPRVSLLPASTPLEPMARAGAHAGHPQLWVKRDDCMSLGLGGNKVRNLEFWVGQALERNSDLLVIAGAAASNQIRLTAAAAAKLGLECLVLYAGPESSPAHSNRLLTEMMGARIRHLGNVDETERARLAAKAVAELAAAGRRPYLVGDPVIGALGYVRAARELHEQAVAIGLDLRHIVLPGSMGITEAGIVLGAAMLDLPWTFHLISVEYEADELAARIGAIIADLCRLTGFEPAHDILGCLRIHMDQLGAGYGSPTDASIEASRLFARLEALVLEQTYVAKTFAGLLSCVDRGDIPGHEAACIVHTGGTPAVFGPSSSLIG